MSVLLHVLPSRIWVGNHRLVKISTTKYLQKSHTPSPPKFQQINIAIRKKIFKRSEPQNPNCVPPPAPPFHSTITFLAKPPCGVWLFRWTFYLCLIFFFRCLHTSKFPGSPVTPISSYLWKQVWTGLYSLGILYQLNKLHNPDTHQIIVWIIPEQ